MEDTSSGVISIIALRDLDVLVNVTNCTFIYLEMMRASAIMHRTIFIDWLFANEIYT